MPFYTKIISIQKTISNAFLYSYIDIICNAFNTTIISNAIIF